MALKPDNRQAMAAGIAAINAKRSAEEQGGPSYLARAVPSLPPVDINPQGTEMRRQLQAEADYAAYQAQVLRMQSPRSRR